LLVVEDDFLIGALLTEQLEELGYVVVGPASSLDEASRLAVDAPINGALLDINLGVGRSNSIAEILIARKIPILFVSGYRQTPDEKFRAIPILSKPFTLATLKAAVENIFGPP
jgi:DNA-binding response OmpR family regulator